MPRQSLIARKDGRYTCKYNGRNFYGKTPAEALKKRDAYIKDCTQGYDPDYEQIPFRDYGLEWLEVYRTECNTKMKQQYKKMIEYAADTIKKTTVRSINATDIQRLYNTLSGKSASYISKFCGTIRAIFRAAVQDGVIIRSPAELAQPPRGTSGGHRCLERWEQDLIVSTFSEHDFGLCAMVMLFAGLRRGEVINLDVDRDVDFVKKTITVRGAASFSEGNQATITKGKTKAAQRTIPLNECLEKALRFHHGLLCTKQNGSMLSLTSFNRKYESYLTFLEKKLNGCPARWYGKTKEHKALLKQGLPLPPWQDIHIRCHDFRVTFCTICYEAGIPIKTLQYWMGHTDASMIMKVYAKLTAEKEQEGASILNDFTKSRFLA